jgi:hypothetical protein
MAPLDWVLIVSTGIGGLFGLVCLFDGARRLKLYGTNAASWYLIGVGAAICLALAGYALWAYRERGGAQPDFVEFVTWLVWGAAALVFGALFAREPKAAPTPTDQIAKIEPVPPRRRSPPLPLPRPRSLLRPCYRLWRRRNRPWASIPCRWRSPWVATPYRCRSLR